MVGPEGMEKFCEDIGVEPENVSSFSFLCFWILRQVWLQLHGLLDLSLYDVNVDIF